MNENYIHFLWKVKRLPFHNLQTTNKQFVHVKSTGVHNLNASGPDFLNGCVEINGIEWTGNIEMHLKSSDWFLHNHHKDKAYENVILHVVLDYDSDIFIHGEKIPTIELRNLIDWNHFDNWEKFARSTTEINCQKSLLDLDPIYIYSMMDRAIIDRLNRKTFLLKNGNSEMNPKEMLYFLIARAFGSKLNQLPFEEITHRLPLSLLKQFSRNKQKIIVELTSGLDFEKTNRGNTTYSKKLSYVEQHAWKRKGLRPSSFPEIRVRQFALLVATFDFDLALEYLESAAFVTYFHDNIRLVNSKMEPRFQISNTFSNLVLINSLVPFLWWYSEIIENYQLRDRVIEILETLKPESNWIIDKWKDIGIKPKSGYETQALIELYNEFCARNKCLSCQVGVKILSND